MKQVPCTVFCLTGSLTYYAGLDARLSETECRGRICAKTLMIDEVKERRDPCHFVYRSRIPMDWLDKFRDIRQWNTEAWSEQVWCLEPNRIKCRHQLQLRLEAAIERQQRLLARFHDDLKNGGWRGADWRDPIQRTTMALQQRDLNG